MMIREKRLTSLEMLKTLETFVECFDLINNHQTEAEKVKIDSFVKEINLMIPCFSLRPDKMQSLNDSIFNDSVITQFILDLSFRFFTLTGDHDDFIDRLIVNLKDGLTIDGDNTSQNIIPESISQSCPTNIFKDIPTDSELKWWKNFLPNSDKNILTINNFLVNNKHIVVLYLIYLTSK